jgi:hypothetical protein
VILRDEVVVQLGRPDELFAVEFLAPGMPVLLQEALGNGSSWSSPGSGSGTPWTCCSSPDSHCGARYGCWTR